MPVVTVFKKVIRVGVNRVALQAVIQVDIGIQHVAVGQLVRRNRKLEGTVSGTAGSHHLVAVQVIVAVLGSIYPVIQRDDDTGAGNALSGFQAAVTVAAHGGCIIDVQRITAHCHIGIGNCGGQGYAGIGCCCSRGVVHHVIVSLPWVAAVELVRQPVLDVRGEN